MCNVVVLNVVLIFSTTLLHHRIPKHLFSTTFFQTGETVDEDDDESTAFDEVIFKLVDHIAAEEKVTEEGQEDAIEEHEEEEKVGNEDGT